ncbi:MAG: hypothetical protein DMF81_25220 [Acidobacteria bacterium]|nr:MAG: hypothetical protein DMF81_25220 [Acidobacteriota bacterium]
MRRPRVAAIGVTVAAGSLCACLWHASRHAPSRPADEVAPSTASSPPSRSADVQPVAPAGASAPEPAPPTAAVASASPEAPSAPWLAAPEPSPPPLPAVSDRSPVRVEMKNVNLHMTDRVVLRIHSVRGALLRTARNRPPVFDDKESFVMRIDAGEIAMSTASLTALMNDYVLNYRKAPIKELEITTTPEGQLRQEGVLDKAVDIPFKVKAELGPTPDGRIRVHAKSIKAAGVPVKGLMGLLGIEMDDMVKIQAGRGIVVDGNDFILDPQRMLPPPRIRGKVTSVRIEGEQVIQVFGSGPAPGRQLFPYPRYRNYMYFRGGNLRFGKLTMADADLALIDQDPKDPFDFNLDRYNDQLVAGYSKNTPSHGLKTFMPDANDLTVRTARGATARPTLR